MGIEGGKKMAQKKKKEGRREGGGALLKGHSFAVGGWSAGDIRS